MKEHDGEDRVLFGCLALGCVMALIGVLTVMALAFKFVMWLVGL